MKTISKRNMEAAELGEHRDHVRYSQYAVNAEREGFKNIARLFRAIAYSEEVHAVNHFNTREATETTEANLRRAIEVERYEATEMYPAFVKAAELQNEDLARVSMQYALDVEKIHTMLFEQALEAAVAGTDMSIGSIFICPSCGSVETSTAPEKCAACGSPGSRFRVF